VMTVAFWFVNEIGKKNSTEDRTGHISDTSAT
jgi:hypothetical protein